MPNEKPTTAHVLRGEYFNVAVNVHIDPPHYRVVIRSRGKRARAGSRGDRIVSTPEEARELAALTKTAAAMADHLKDGGNIEHWFVEESWFPAPSRN